MKSPYINRELSWLKFNERVLEEAEDSKNPIFERAKFISIFSNNLNEFFMVRVGSLHDQGLLPDPKADNKTGLFPAEQLAAIFDAVADLIPRKDAVYRSVCQQLKKHGLEHVWCSNLRAEDEEFLHAYFKSELLPLLSAQVIDKRHPFPFLKNLQRYICVRLASKSKSLRFGLVPVEDFFPLYIRLPGQGFRLALTSDVILHYVPEVFKKFTILDQTIFRVTRNADINIEEGLFDEDIDFRDAMKDLLKTRKKLCAVRLDLYQHSSADLEKYITKKLDLTPAQVFVHRSPLDLSYIFAIENHVQRALGQDLFFPPQHSRQPKFLDPARPVMQQAMEHDILLCYPYESMQHFIRLLTEAASDPDVVSIKISLYRVAKNSKVIDALIKASENGKQVFALVELRARFDEQNNIDWAEHLEDAGVTISYGLDDYKTHSKVCLITRKSEQGISHITQIGTGNYNEKTARQYTDMALITAHPGIASDAVEFFNNISLGATTPASRHLLIAPCTFRERLLTLIDEQIALAKEGGDAQIILKANALTDKPIIDRLIKASKAGVPIQMIIRGICCLQAGLPHLTKNIEVRSIVGRYLEHARIYSFGTGKHQKLFISSGDLMTRSTQSRAEVATPIYDPKICEEINRYLYLQLNDNVKARRMRTDGTYEYVRDDNPPCDSQAQMFQV